MYFTSEASADGWEESGLVPYSINKHDHFRLPEGQGLGPAAPAEG